MRGEHREAVGALGIRLGTLQWRSAVDETVMRLPPPPWSACEVAAVTLFPLLQQPAREEEYQQLSLALIRNHWARGWQRTDPNSNRCWLRSWDLWLVHEGAGIRCPAAAPPWYCAIVTLPGCTSELSDIMRALRWSLGAGPRCLCCWDFDEARG